MASFGRCSSSVQLNLSAATAAAVAAGLPPLQWARPGNPPRRRPRGKRRLVRRGLAASWPTSSAAPTKTIDPVSAFFASCSRRRRCWAELFAVLSGRAPSGRRFCGWRPAGMVGAAAGVEVEVEVVGGLTAVVPGGAMALVLVWAAEGRREGLRRCEGWGRVEKQPSGRRMCWPGMSSSRFEKIEHRGNRAPRQRSGVGVAGSTGR